MFKLRLNNFRGFLDQEFNFSRVNILIGENSAGKSSILKFLLAVRQSFVFSDNRSSNFTFSGESTDLGNYKGTIFNHDVRRNLGFGFEFGREYFDFFLDFFMLPNEPLEAQRSKRKEITESLGGQITSPTEISFRLSNDLSDVSNTKTSISNSKIGELQFSHPNSDTHQEVYSIRDYPRCTVEFRSESIGREFTFTDVEFERNAFFKLIQGPSLKKSIDEALGNEFTEEKRDGLFNEMAFLLITQNYVMEHVAGIHYINPLLSEPAARIYVDGDRKYSRNISDIKDVVDYLTSGQTPEKFISDFSTILSDFGIADEVYVKEDGFTRELRIVLDGVDNNIKDVGFGVSLQLPIFAQALLAERTKLRLPNGMAVPSRGRTLLIEQPEVHLHPHLQAKFMDAILKIGNRNIYFIETHSEHLVRMLQLIVKEGRHGIKPKDISINYFGRDDAKLIHSEHVIQDDGRLNPVIPQGFYDVSYDLAFQLMD